MASSAHLGRAPPHLPQPFPSSALSIFLKYKDGIVRELFPRPFLSSSPWNKLLLHLCRRWALGLLCHSLAAAPRLPGETLFSLCRPLGLSCGGGTFSGDCGPEDNGLYHLPALHTLLPSLLQRCASSLFPGGREVLPHMPRCPLPASWLSQRLLTLAL